MSSDIDNLEKYVPDDPDLFDIAISLDIGIENEEGADIFQVSILTPKWLLMNCAKNEIFIPRHSLIVQQYDYSNIVQKLNKICIKCQGNSWEECSLKLSRYFQWEFEDYKD